MKTYSITDPAFMQEIIRKSSVCFVGLCDESGAPYVFPMNFGYEDGVVYLHSAREGRNIEIIKNNPRTCITFCLGAELKYQDVEVACSYRMKSESVICRGNIEFVEDLAEKERILNILMAQYTDRKFTYSEPALRNVQVWMVKVREMTGKIFGEKHNLSF